MNNNILYTYTNGNTEVSIFNDGTKIRSYNEKPFVIHPESIDVKITNYCEPTINNPICSYCHESSGLHGKHGNLDDLLKILEPLPSGVEICLGGGNTVSHPQLLPFLKELRNSGLVSNITINQKHLKDYRELILNIINDRLVYGVGISYSSSSYFEDIKPIIQASDNVVFHLIMGINTLSDIDALMTLCQEYGKTCKILILGYKVFGFGINYYLKNKKIEDNKYQWCIRLASYFKKPGLVLSFDNLAIQQLKLRRFFTKEAWNEFYMGSDGTHTCFIDAVKQEYAISSTSNGRVSFEGIDLLEFFKNYCNKESL